MSIPVKEGGWLFNRGGVTVELSPRRLQSSRLLAYLCDHRPGSLLYHSLHARSTGIEEALNREVKHV